MAAFRKTVISKPSLIPLLFVLVFFAIAVGPIRQTNASPAKSQQTTLACRDSGNLTSFNATTNAAGEITLGPYYTTRYCNDIQVQFTHNPSEVGVDVCWTKHNVCRTQQGYLPTYINGGNTGWYDIATNVLDGTEFTVHIVTYPNVQYSGRLAF